MSSYNAENYEISHPWQHVNSFLAYFPYLKGKIRLWHHDVNASRILNLLITLKPSDIFS
jgi:hypothetical protein